MYSLIENCIIYIEGKSIPLDPANSDYQRVLDDIIEQDTDCFTGDIPTELQTAADAKQFAQQVEAYKIAKARVAQYQLSVGVPESTQTITTGMQEWNEEAGEMQDVTETIVIPAIPALEATVEVTTYDMETDTSSTETVQLFSVSGFVFEDSTKSAKSFSFKGLVLPIFLSILGW